MITRYAVLTLVVCLVCGAFGRGAVETYAVFLPTLGRAFGWTQIEATSVYAVLHLGAGFASFPLGRVYDRRGPRRTLALGFLACGGGMLLASQATGLWLLSLFPAAIFFVITWKMVMIFLYGSEEAQEKFKILYFERTLKP